MHGAGEGGPRGGRAPHPLGQREPKRDQNGAQNGQGSGGTAAQANHARFSLAMSPYIGWCPPPGGGGRGCVMVLLRGDRSDRGGLEPNT